MSKRHKKQSSEKDDASEDKKPEKAEMGKTHKKEQLSQRLRDIVEYTKPKSSLDLQESTEGSPAKCSTDTHRICDDLVPLEEREKISVCFKKKAKCSVKRSNVGSVAAFSSKDEFEAHLKRKKTDLQDLRILNCREKNKKKDKEDLKKLKEIIKRHALVEFKDTLQPPDCSLVHKKKTLNSYGFIRKHSTSEDLNASALNSSDPKMHIQKSRAEIHERAKHGPSERPSKNEKGMKCKPLCRIAGQSKHWKGKQKEQSCSATAKNIDHVPTQEFIFQRSQNPEALSSSSFESTGNTDADQEMQIVEDLHAARNDRKIVLPVVQTCGELTSMEIDLPDEESNLFSKMIAGLNVLIVIDTNIMISHLEFIKSLKNRDFPGIGRFVLVIPWVVLQELDSLKRGKILANVGKKAIPAIRFIYMCLKNQDSKLWGQSMQLASQKTDNFVVGNNDDRVLQCCLQYRNLFPQAEVVLLTDDKNLCNKALVSEIKAFTKADFVTALQKLSPKTVIISQDIFSYQSHSEKDRESQKTEEVTTDQISGIIFDTKKCLGEVLSCILETELKIAYGEDLWAEVVYQKPPWTLANVLECYKKHWVAVFGLVISRSFSSTIEYLYAELCKSKVIKNSDMKKVLQESKMLLETFCPRSNYDGALPRALDQVEKLLEALEKARDPTFRQSATGPTSSGTFKCISGDGTCEKMDDVALTQDILVGDKSLTSESFTEGNKHVEIWSVLQSVWDTVNQFSLEVFQKLDPSAIANSQNMTSFKEALESLQKLMAAVSEILSGIRQVLVPNSTFHNVWSLHTFLTNSEINNIKFTAEELYDCISQEMYRNRLLVGYNQLVQLEHTIKHQYESVCLEIKNRGWL